MTQTDTLDRLGEVRTELDEHLAAVEKLRAERLRLVAIALDKERTTATRVAGIVGQSKTNVLRLVEKFYAAGGHL